MNNNDLIKIARLMSGYSITKVADDDPPMYDPQKSTYKAPSRASTVMQAGGETQLKTRPAPAVTKSQPTSDPAPAPAAATDKPMPYSGYKTTVGRLGY